MKLELRLRPGDDVRLLWLFVLCVLAGGSFYVQTRYERAISAAYVRIDQLYQKTVADSRIAAQAGSFHSVQNHVEADLARVSRDASLSQSTAALLQTLHAAGRRFDASVLEVQPSAGTAPAGDALQPVDLTLRIRGSFRHILAFVEDLSHHAILIRVSGTEISLSHGDASATGGNPPLEATIHATLYRLQRPKKDTPVASVR